MHKSGLTELKASLSETLARVKAGEEVLVTERGRPIARIVPVLESAPETAVDRLIRRGIVRAPKEKIDQAFWDMPRGDDPTGAALRALLGDRRDER